MQLVNQCTWSSWLENLDEASHCSFSQLSCLHRGLKQGFTAVLYHNWLWHGQRSLGKEVTGNDSYRVVRVIDYVFFIKYIHGLSLLMMWLLEDQKVKNNVPFMSGRLSSVLGSWIWGLTDKPHRQYTWKDQGHVIHFLLSSTQVQLDLKHFWQWLHWPP